MSKLKPKGLVGSIPMKTKYADIIKYVKQHMKHIEGGKLVEVDLDYASESSNLTKALNSHTGKRFNVSVRTSGDSITGYIKLVSSE